MSPVSSTSGRYILPFKCQTLSSCSRYVGIFLDFCFIKVSPFVSPHCLDEGSTHTCPLFFLLSCSLQIPFVLQRRTFSFRVWGLLAKQEHCTGNVWTSTSLFIFEFNTFMVFGLWRISSNMQAILLLLSLGNLTFFIVAIFSLKTNVK